MDAELYPYSRPDKADDRRRYFYAAYRGAALLQGWNADRTAALAELPAPAEPPPGGGCEPDRDGTIVAAEALDWAWARRGEPAALALLDDFVRRFEVWVRIHDAFRPGFKAVDPAAFQTWGNYVRLAELLDDAFARSRKLPYLNTLLKCLDSLLARRELLDDGQRARLARLILAEAAHVRTVAAAAGVERVLP